MSGCGLSLPAPFIFMPTGICQNAGRDKPRTYKTISRHLIHF